MNGPTFINANLSIFEKENSLAFGTDAYLLAAYLRREPKRTACELGAGSGVISLLAMGHHKFSHITAIEVQPSIAALASLNVEKNGFSGQIDVLCADIRVENALPRASFDTVFANPPYMRADSGKTSEDSSDASSRHELFGGIADFTAAASRYLRYGGRFYAVYRPDRLTDLLSACRASDLEPKRMTLVYPTEHHAPCLVLLEAKKGAAAGIYVTPPLQIYRTGAPQTVDCYTEQMNAIYQNGEFHESYQNP